MYALDKFSNLWRKSKGIFGILSEKKEEKKNLFAVGTDSPDGQQQRMSEVTYFGNSVTKLTEIAATPVPLLSKHCWLFGCFENWSVACT